MSYFLRNVNAVLAPLIVEELDLSASEIGLLTSLYFLSAALVLVPVAVALDRYGPRRVLMAQMAIAAAGCFLFAAGGSVETLACGRALIGFGVAGCLTTAFKAVTVWMPRDRWATGNSLVLAIGSLGVICGTRPLQWGLEIAGWREMFWLAGGTCLTVLAALAAVVPERNAETREAGASSLSIYRDIIRHPAFWRLMPVASLTMAVFFALQGLWANGWMSDVAGLTQAEIGARLLLMAVAMSLGMLANGSLGDLLARVGIPLGAVMTAGVTILLTAQLALVLEWQPRAWWPWAALGYAGNIGALAYPQMARRFPDHASARAMSAIAISNFALAFAVQSALGVMLDLWPRSTAGAYPAEAYGISLGAMFVLQIGCFAWFLAAREAWRPPGNVSAEQRRNVI